MRQKADKGSGQAPGHLTKDIDKDIRPKNGVYIGNKKYE
jgi:hypothetical protein